MALVIKDAVKLNLRARIALLSPTGGGKTFTMLKFLFAMVKLGMAKRVGVIDTEHGAASKYVGEFPKFRVIELEEDFSPEVYIEAWRLLAEDGCDAVGTDSLTHAWAGKGGALEQKDTIGRKPGFNDYTAWGPISKMQNRMIEAMLTYPGHLVATMRVKMEHVIEKDPITGKNTVRKVGLQPIQRDGLEFEFDLVGDLDQDHNFTVSKTRCSALDGYFANKPGEEVIRKLQPWLESGEAAQARVVARPPVAETAASKPADPPPISIAPAIVPATSTATTDAQPARPADAFAAQIAAADTLDKLDGIAATIGPAVKAGAITSDERRALVFAYTARKTILARVAA